MGTVYRRGEKWRAEVHKNGERRSATFMTKRQALDWIGKTETALLAGPRSSPTMRTALDRYAEESGRSRWDILRLGAFRREDWSALPIAEVTPKVIAAWRDQRLSEVAPGTVIREMTLLRAVFEAARRDWEWIDRNPLADVRRPPAPEPRKRLVADEEIAEMTRSLGYRGQVNTVEHEVAVAMLLALETGMRAGELLALKWPDVDADRRVARLHRSKTGPGREVPLSSRAVELFAVMKAKRLVRVRTIRKGFVFHVTGQTLDTLFRRARGRAALSGFTFHDLRATAATRLSRVLDPRELARMLGHSDLNSLMIYYRESAESIAARLG